MATFKMMNRPKKPTEPRAISEEIGDEIFFSELLEKADKFRTTHQLASITQIEVVVGENWSEGYCICLETEGKTHVSYNKEMLVYKAELKKYNNWRKDNRVEIEKQKATTKEKIRVRKLEKRLAKATKDAEDLRVQLECSK